MPKYFLLIITILSVLGYSQADAEVLTADTIWKGEVDLREDILIPPAVTLTITAGTRIKVWPADNTKIDPEYLSHQTEILVRGKLIANGSKTEKIIVDLMGNAATERWAGFIIDHGVAELSHCVIRNSEAAVTVVNGSLTLKDAQITNNRYGVVGQSSSATLDLSDSLITKNDYGLLEFDGPQVTRNNLSVTDNEKDDFIKEKSPNVVVKPQIYKASAATIRHTYKDEALVGVTVWKGKVLISGQLRLPPDARLIILPGTVIEFSKRDTNNDGIGENGIMVQGLLIAKGTPDAPIIFRSAEQEKNIGDWDSINILGSDLAQNLMEYCQIENAYRGVHFHFSNVAVNHCIFRNSYRGAQFQESLVSVTNSQFYNNKSAVQARDSEVIFHNNELFFNINGANFFRFNLQAHDNSFGPNRWDGLRIREGTTQVYNNRMTGNRTGLLVADTVFGNFSGNVMAANLETGLMLRNSDNIEVRANAIERNGINGISVRDTRAVIADNLIAANGQRGIGIVSFTGVIEKNNILANKLYAIGLEGADDINAKDNFWGESDLAKEIYDRSDEAALGRVEFEPQRSAPVSFPWPLPDIKTDLTWAGEIDVHENISIPAGASLTVLPSTKVVFAQATGMQIFGNIRAQGEKGRRITFTSRSQSGAEGWGEISMEHAGNSVFTNCDFEYATWGLHCHFVPIKISYCRFMNNDGGLRFRSGPIEVANCLFIQNRIGLRSFRGIVDINYSDFHDNEIGIFVREGGSGVKIHHNNLYENERYNLRLGDFNKENVDAANNWWGGKDPLTTIFDGRIESYIGMVDFEPVLPAPVSLEEIR